ncbi:MAG: hypothetical protein ACUVS2_03570 [Candidatus Flexifilum sp.]|jgi:hypothetical protein
MQIDPTTLPTIALALCGCCLLGVILLFALQILDIVGTLFGAVFDLIGGVLGAGPGGWCGCLVTIGVLAMCGLVVLFIVNALQACGTPQATNLCTLFGR